MKWAFDKRKSRMELNKTSKLKTECIKIQVNAKIMLIDRYHALLNHSQSDQESFYTV